MPFDPEFSVVTPRLILRRIRADDLPALLEVNGDDETTRFLPYASWRSPADAEAWLARMRGYEAKGDTWQFVLEHRELRRAIGTCLVFRHSAEHARAELGYVLGRAHWRQGLMQESLRAFLPVAFNELRLQRLEAELESRNVASARLLERLGFVREALFRSRWFEDGQSIDAVVYGLLRSDLRGSSEDGSQHRTLPG